MKLWLVLLILLIGCGPKEEGPPFPTFETSSLLPVGQAYAAPGVVDERLDYIEDNFRVLESTADKGVSDTSVGPLHQYVNFSMRARGYHVLAPVVYYPRQDLSREFSWAYEPIMWSPDQGAHRQLLQYVINGQLRTINWIIGNASTTVNISKSFTFDGQNHALIWGCDCTCRVDADCCQQANSGTCQTQGSCVANRCEYSSLERDITLCTAWVCGGVAPKYSAFTFDIDEQFQPQDIAPSWQYQLQSPNLQRLQSLNVSFYVLDIDESNYTLSQLSSLNGTVLSYLSIGEAEDYRSYWESDWAVGNPVFIDAENPEFQGNYKVQYFNDIWQQIMMNQTKKIVDAGYDGMYLDIIDAYFFYEEQGRVNASQEMIDFVIRLTNYSRQLHPGFIVVPQNAVELYEFEPYRRAINGFGVEDTWYDDNSIQDSSHTAQVLHHLQRARNDSKFVLAIDYPTSQENICAFYSLCANESFHCTVSNRDLDLNTSLTCIS